MVALSAIIIKMFKNWKAVFQRAVYLACVMLLYNLVQ